MLRAALDAPAIHALRRARAALRATAPPTTKLRQLVAATVGMVRHGRRALAGGAQLYPEGTVTYGGERLSNAPLLILDALPGTWGADSPAGRRAVFAGGLIDWLATTAVDASGRSALAVVVKAAGLPTRVAPFRPTWRASVPTLDRLAGDGAARRLSGFPGRDAPPRPAQLNLPGFRPGVGACTSWLLWLFDTAGGASMAQGRGAPWAMRLFVGALLHLPIPARDGHWRTVPLPTEDVIEWLHPRGWANRRRDWDKLPAALDAMRELAYVPIPGIGSVALLFPSVIPRRPTDPGVEFTIRVPGPAAHGARIDWPTLCRYGADSAGLYRAYLSVSAFLDRTAHRGHAITAEIATPMRRPDGTSARRKGGQIMRDALARGLNPLARYVAPLSEADLARMIGFDPTNRDHRRKTRRAFDRLHNDRVIDLRRKGDGVRIFGPGPPNP